MIVTFRRYDDTPTINQNVRSNDLQIYRRFCVICFVGNVLAFIYIAIYVLCCAVWCMWSGKANVTQRNWFVDNSFTSFSYLLFCKQFSHKFIILSQLKIIMNLAVGASTFIVIYLILSTFEKRVINSIENRAWYEYFKLFYFKQRYGFECN